MNLAVLKPYLLDKRSVVDRHTCHIAAKFGVFVDEDHDSTSVLKALPGKLVY